MLSKVKAEDVRIFVQRIASLSLKNYVERVESMTLEDSDALDLYLLLRKLRTDARRLLASYRVKRSVVSGKTRIRRR